MKRKLSMIILLTANLLGIVGCEKEEKFSYEEPPYNYTPYVEEGADPEFEEYLNDFFADYLGDDYLSWNIFTIKAENFGFNREEAGEATWYYYEREEEGQKEKDYEELQGYYDILTAFDTSKLTANQMISYEALDEFFRRELEYANPENGYDSLMRLNYVDQFGGYAADFGTYMEAYEFWDENCINDALSYIKSLKTSFPTYLTYCDDKAEAGYPISDFTLDEQINYINDAMDFEGDYYLVDILCNKVDNVVFLSPKKKESYKNKFKHYVADYLVPAYKELAAGLEDYKGRCTTEGYLAAYGEDGKKMYEFLLRNRLGYEELDMEWYGSYLKERLDYYKAKMDSTLDLYYSLSGDNASQFQKYVNGQSVITTSDPNDMIAFLKEFAKTIVPELEATPEITVKYMDDATAKVSNAVAYYMKSALDNSASEHITLNGTKLSSDLNDTLSTMAHEGYPGHLYAYLYDKQLPISNIAKIMTSTAHAEGWATYVQYKLYNYLKKHSTCKSSALTGLKTYLDYSFYNEILGYLAYTYFDYGIHYKGFDVVEITSVMNELGFNASASQDIYRTLIECPGEYAAYGYGMSHFIDIHDHAKSILGNDYNEIEFNAAIMSQGWVGYDRLDKVIDAYYKSKGVEIR